MLGLHVYMLAEKISCSHENLYCCNASTKCSRGLPLSVPTVLHKS